MRSLKATPKTLTLLTAGVVIFPRFLSDHGLSYGTVSILLFWIGMLVLLPDWIDKFESKPIKINTLPLSTKTIMSLCVIYGITACLLVRPLFSETDSSYILKLA
jgi:hypothetical protein